MSDLKIFTDTIEPEALNQIYTLVKQPAFSNAKVRIMPDVHAGKGCVIGFTADLGKKVIPNIVGVDIGCGMLATRIEEPNIDFRKLDKVIRESVPYGKGGVWAAPECTKEFPLIDRLFCKNELKNVDYLRSSLGTLGGGNHFIEVDATSDGEKYLIIHTGSRNLGKQVAEIYQQKAVDSIDGLPKLKEACETLIAEYKKAGRRKDIKKGLAELKRKWQPEKRGIPKELCYLTGKDREDYLHDMEICQIFAEENREQIRDVIFKNMGWRLPNSATFKGVSNFHTIHNYIDMDTNIVRKGAISARKGQVLLIPLNMRDGCILGVGKGNEEWNCSAPHGAGRLMSRSKAKEEISLDDYKSSMQGIYTTSVTRATIDESPLAYKPMEKILGHIGDTVEVLDVMKPLYNFKASD